MSRRLERIAGGIMIDGNQVGETLQCVHCGMHWDRKPGSGTERGFCLRCRGVTCNMPACVECVPFEQWMEDVEEADKIEQRRLRDLFELAGQDYEVTPQGLVVARR